MAFDMGFNFRGTSGYVTDGAEGVPVLAEVYPHTYTNGNGDSINAGFVSGSGQGAANRSTGVDARLAGINYDGGTDDFQVDLSSGSAPGAGDYTVDLAVGDSGGGPHSGQVFWVKDNTTTLIDGSGPYSTAQNHFIDATLTDVAGGTTWAGTAVSKTFASTTAKFGFNGQAAVTYLAHFRLTKQEAAAFQAAWAAHATVTLTPGRPG